jgi:L-rhamnose mutarotase
MRGVLLCSVVLLLAVPTGSAQATRHSKQEASVTPAPQAIHRYCLTLDLKDDPELIKEYRKYHARDGIWPEIPKGIREVGILDMEIYLLGTRLFMILEAPADWDFDKQMAKLATLPRQKEWEAFVSKFQKAGADAKSSEKWKMMDRIFKLPR